MTLRGKVLILLLKLVGQLNADDLLKLLRLLGQFFIVYLLQDLLVLFDITLELIVLLFPQAFQVVILGFLDVVFLLVEGVFDLFVVSVVMCDADEFAKFLVFNLKFLKSLIRLFLEL